MSITAQLVSATNPVNHGIQESNLVGSLNC